MKRLFMAYAWLMLSTGIILTSIASLQLGQYWDFFTAGKSLEPESQPVVIAAASDNATENTGDVKGISTVMEVEDARAQIVANFLKRHNSPLEPHDHFGQVFVDLADKNGFDFRLLPSIAMQESNLCKSIPENSYNCLGFGIHERGTLTFESYEANFERAARELKKNYIDIGLDTPEKIMRKYTPSSDGSWAASVNQWMAEMRYDDRALGRELKKDASVLEFVEKATPAPSASPTPQTN